MPEAGGGGVIGGGVVGGDSGTAPATGSSLAVTVKVRRFPRLDHSDDPLTVRSIDVKPLLRTTKA